MLSFTHVFQCEGKSYACTRKAKFLVETTFGTSSYTLDRGFGNPEEAVTFYSEISVGGTKKKRLTMIDCGVRTVIARTK